MIWTAKEAAIATKGQAFTDWQGGKLVFDSRLIEKGDIFIALPGGNSDGHIHVAQAFAKGAAGAIVERIPEGVTNDKLLLVKNTLVALNDLANFKRAKSKAKFIAVTGSVGKTSTKELLGLAFNVHGRTFISRGNYNNFLGVPINLASMPDDREYVIIEIGMDHAGEITPLTQMVQPDVTIITGIEHIHQANFASIEDIAKAKAEIFAGIKPHGIAIINSLSNCYDLLKASALKNPNIEKLISIGKDSKILKYEIKNNQTKADLNIEDKTVLIDIDSIIGAHQIHNMLTALAIVNELNLDVYKSAKSLESFELPKGRGQVSKVNIAGKVITLIDDSYNAGPVSMRAALKNLSYYQGRKIAILGDMVDMGPNSLAIHLSLKEDIIASNIDKVICFGEQMRHLSESLPNNTEYGSYLDLKELARVLPTKLESGDVLLIKGSFYLTRLYYFTQHLREGTLDAL
jgi:UDP-N-acetylmuramoyl-tripeptide--D-alanyl-D-alanine ligase